MRSGLVVAGKYRIGRELGSGGMGSVWQAVNVVTEREFAIKFLHASSAASSSLLARFFQEAKVSGRLRHPSIIEVFDLGQAPELGGAPFLVMELLDGASLDVLIRKAGPLPPRVVLEIVAETSRALSLAHDKGIVHRDLKPANIFLHRPGTGAVVPKVLDFGISKIAPAGAPEVSSGLTQTGTVLGSPLYMSPEQAASDKTIDGRSDVHALGIVMWECLVGEPPFATDTYNNLVVRIITGDRPSLAQSLPSASPGVAAIVERAMARRREDRFQSAAELADAAEAELARMGPGPTLSSRTAAAELFARVQHTSMKPEPSTSAGSTTGGMAVPSQPRVPHGSSPAAYTVGATPGAAHSPTAYGETQAAPVAVTLASTVESTRAEPPGPHVLAATPATVATTTDRTPPARRGAAIGVVVAVVGVVAAGAAAIVIAGRHPTAPAIVAATGDPAPPPVPPSAPPPAPAPLPASATPPASAAASVAPPAATTATPVLHPIGRPPPPKRRDTVESSGF